MEGYKDSTWNKGVTLQGEIRAINLPTQREEGKHDYKFQISEWNWQCWEWQFYDYNYSIHGDEKGKIMEDLHYREIIWECPDSYWRSETCSHEF